MAAERGKTSKHTEALRKRILHATARSILERGYDATTLRAIAQKARTNYGSIQNLYPTKEDMLCDLVNLLFSKQFRVAGGLLDGITSEPLMLYVAETVLQLHIVEMSESLRNTYCAAYSLPKSSEIIQKATTAKVEVIFREYLPGLQTRDFYKREIASGGVMRGFMTIPCNMWFTMDQKVEAFLEATCLIYRVPEEKIREAIAFSKQFDFELLARKTIQGIMEYLDKTESQLYTDSRESF